MSARRGETRGQFRGARLRWRASFARLRSRSPTPAQPGARPNPSLRSAVAVPRRTERVDADSLHQRRRLPGPWAGRARHGREVPGHGGDRRARPRAERHQPLAHHAPPAPRPPRARGGAPRGRHPHGLHRPGGGRPAGGAPGLRALGGEPRPQHGRGRALLGHRGGGDGGHHPGDPLGGGVVRGARPGGDPRLRTAAGAPAAAAAARRASRRRRCSTSTCRPWTRRRSGASG